jgi:hypothetical protein
MNQLNLKLNRLKLKTLGKIPIIFEEYPQISKGKPKDYNMEPVGLGNPRTPTNYAQEYPRTMFVFTIYRL